MLNNATYIVMVVIVTHSMDDTGRMNILQEKKQTNLVMKTKTFYRPLVHVVSGRRETERVRQSNLEFLICC